MNNLVGVVEGLINNFTLEKCIQWTATLVLLGFVIKSADYVGDWIQHRRAKALQIEKFYRESSGENLGELLDLWTKLYLDITQNDDYQLTTTELQSLVRKTMKSASSETDIILISMLQTNYQEKATGFVQMVYMSMIVNSLKKDFTGSSDGEMSLLKTWVTDYYDSEKELKSAYKIVIKEIKKTKCGVTNRYLKGTVMCILIFMALLLLFCPKESINFIVNVF